jgi:hypothetical protein
MEVHLVEQEAVKLATAQGIWAVLFIGLFFYVLRTGEAREKRLSDTSEEREKRLTETLNKVADKLSGDVNALRADVDELRSDVRNFTGARR